MLHKDPELSPKASTHESIAFVITHTSIGSKLGAKKFEKEQTHPIILTFDKQGGLAELKKIKQDMKDIIQQNPSTQTWKLYCEFNACMSGQNKMTAIYLLTVFPENQIDDFSLHGMLGSGGEDIEISEEEKTRGIRAMSSKEATDMLTSQDKIKELAKQFKCKEVDSEQKSFSDNRQQRRLDASFEALTLSPTALYAQPKEQQLLSAAAVDTSEKTKVPTSGRVL